MCHIINFIKVKGKDIPLISKILFKSYLMEEIRINFKVKTDAENLETLKELIKLSPVYDVVSSGTRVNVQIEKK